jgi:predicted amidophosphoribosyltransferase
MNNSSIKILSGVLASLVACCEAYAQGSSLPYGGGGPINAPKIIREYNQSGKQMRIEGSCQSSCTMLLAIKNVCVDPSATLKFHAALFPNEVGQKPPPARQAQMLASYNAKLRNYLVSNGYVATFEFHTISGRDIIQKFGYKACS